jgi:6-phosphogluconate dehydrogenase
MKEFGIIGLGKIGSNLSRQAIKKSYRVIGHTLYGVSQDLLEIGVEEAKNIEEFKQKLEAPRAIFLYVPAGPVVDELVEKFIKVLEPGDIVIDGGNSYWGDSVRRCRYLKSKDLHFIDVGTSGGVAGALHGACFMAGGDVEPIRTIEPILRDLAVNNGYVHTGASGTGHFTKLVHNGIEFGMLQAIGEGVDLLERFETKLHVSNILKAWRNGSVIRSWLIDLMESAYREEGGVSPIPPFVEDTGEVNWLISDALKMEVPIPVITQSVIQLFSSRDSVKNWARAIAMMRHGFGGHPYGPDTDIANERKTSRVDETAPINQKTIQ